MDTFPQTASHESCNKRFCIYDVSAPYTVHKPRAIFNRSILTQLS